MSPFLRVNATGFADLKDESMDLLVKTKIVATSKGQGGESLRELKGLTVPIKISGTFSDPDFSLELKSLLESQVKQKIEQKKTEIKEKVEEKVESQIEDKVENKLKDALKGFGF
jgi:AsmA protein